eukprot:543835-Rhodomonas_salina.1
MGAVQTPSGPQLVVKVPPPSKCLLLTNVHIVDARYPGVHTGGRLWAGEGPGHREDHDGRDRDQPVHRARSATVRALRYQGRCVQVRPALRPLCLLLFRL